MRRIFNTIIRHKSRPVHLHGFMESSRGIFRNPVTVAGYLLKPFPVLGISCFFSFLTGHISMPLNPPDKSFPGSDHSPAICNAVPYFRSFIRTAFHRFFIKTLYGLIHFIYQTPKTYIHIPFMIRVSAEACGPRHFPVS